MREEGKSLSYYVVGTAGHIDHGKTALVKALTGQNTDRLKAEKERGITIELGFAHRVLSNGKELAFIDVPGHERFVKNMVAGAAGIDLALLVIAADEGVMPQTKEHFYILQYLKIKNLLIVITKIDLVEEELKYLAKEEIAALLADTKYKDAEIIETSAPQNIGIEELLKAIDNKLHYIKDLSQNYQGARLPIDRIFTVQGFGTVVTGTLFNGSIQVGDILEFPVKKKKARVRNIQIHNKPVKKALAGQRTAINLIGMELSDIKKGDILATPDWLTTTKRIDVILHLINDLEKELKSYERIRFHQGTGEIFGRILLLDKDELKGGEEGFAQIILEQPIVVIRGDQFIIRSYSPPHTIGGGTIIEANASKHKKRDKELFNSLIIKAEGSYKDRTELYLKEKGRLVEYKEIEKYLYFSTEQIDKSLEELVKEERIAKICYDEIDLFLDMEKLNQWEKNISWEIKKHIEKYPLELGADKEAIRTSIKPVLSLKKFNYFIQYLCEKQILKIIEGRYLVPYGYEHIIEKNLFQKIQGIEKYLLQCQWQVPNWPMVLQQINIDEELGKQILKYLLKKEKIVPLAKDIYILRNIYEEGIVRIKDWFIKNESLTVSQARDLLGTTRKIALPLLNHLDKIHITVREGDNRKICK